MTERLACACSSSGYLPDFHGNVTACQGACWRDRDNQEVLPLEGGGFAASFRSGMPIAPLKTDDRPDEGACPWGRRGEKQGKGEYQR